MLAAKNTNRRGLSCPQRRYINVAPAVFQQQLITILITDFNSLKGFHSLKFIFKTLCVGSHDLSLWPTLNQETPL